MTVLFFSLMCFSGLKSPANTVRGWRKPVFFFADANMPEPWADSVFFRELHQIVPLKALKPSKP